jgi:hypothetical protein
MNSVWEIRKCACGKSVLPNETEPPLVPPKAEWRLLSCSNTRGYEQLAAGELVSFRDGKSRKIVATEPTKKH